MDVCNSLDVIPATFFLRHMKDKELDLRHRGFKTEEIHALSKALVVRKLGIEVVVVIVVVFVVVVGVFVVVVVFG